MKIPLFYRRESVSSIFPFLFALLPFLLPQTTPFYAVWRSVDSKYNDNPPRHIPALIGSKEISISTRPSSSPLQCIFVPDNRQTREGIGANLARTQLALFIASWYDTKIEIHAPHSKHGYDLENLFAKCPGPLLPVSNHNGSIHKHPCTLDISRIYVPVNDLQDCESRGKAVQPHVDKLIAKGCKTIIVPGDGFKTSTFSSCLKPALVRNFGKKGPKPTWEYDVIHYRMGDLRGKPGGKSFAPETLQAIVNIMCKTSERDIVILTEGNPKVPKCEDRVVLAADTSIKEAMQIMQFAKKVAVGNSEFAILMMKMANPEAVIIRSADYPVYDWLAVDDWYVLRPDLAVLRYTSQKILREHVHLHGDLRQLKYRYSNYIKKSFGNATRRWNVGMMN